MGRGKLLTKYYAKRRVMRKSGLIKKAEYEDDDEGNVDVDDLAILGKYLFVNPQI